MKKRSSFAVEMFLFLGITERDLMLLKWVSISNTFISSIWYFSLFQVSPINEYKITVSFYFCRGWSHEYLQVCPFTFHFTLLLSLSHSFVFPTRAHSLWRSTFFSWLHLYFGGCWALIHIWLSPPVSWHCRVPMEPYNSFCRKLITTTTHI